MVQKCVHLYKHMNRLISINIAKDTLNLNLKIKMHIVFTGFLEAVNIKLNKTLV